MSNCRLASSFRSNTIVKLFSLPSLVLLYAVQWSSPQTTTCVQTYSTIVTMSIGHPHNLLISSFNCKTKSKNKHISPYVVTTKRRLWKSVHLPIIGFQSTKRFLYPNESLDRNPIIISLYVTKVLFFLHFNGGSNLNGSVIRSLSIFVFIKI